MRSFILSLIILFLVGCSGPERPQTEAEQTRAITKVFETKEQYTARTLDSATVADFLLRHPDSNGDSAAIFSFCSLARFCCGRIIRKYMAAAITTMNRMLSTEKVLTFAWLSARLGPPIS